MIASFKIGSELFSKSMNVFNQAMSVQSVRVTTVAMLILAGIQQLFSEKIFLGGVCFLAAYGVYQIKEIRDLIDELRDAIQKLKTEIFQALERFQVNNDRLQESLQQVTQALEELKRNNEQFSGLVKEQAVLSKLIEPIQALVDLLSPLFKAGAILRISL